MHLFTFLARPAVAPESDGDPAGAYVNCYIAHGGHGEAEALARRLVAEAGWIVEGLEEYRVVTEQDYDRASPGRPYFEQALIDGEVLVFHTWPASGEEGDKA